MAKSTKIPPFRIPVEYYIYLSRMEKKTGISIKNYILLALFHCLENNITLIHECAYKRVDTTPIGTMRVPFTTYKFHKNISEVNNLTVRIAIVSAIAHYIHSLNKKP